MSIANVSVRVDAELKAEVESCLDEMGLKMSTAIVMYLKQIAKRRAIPFAITADPASNPETLAAIREGERIARDPDIKGCKDVSEVLRELKS